MSSSRLNDLPSALQTTIVQYIDDPRSICNLEQCSTSLQVVIRGSGCWKRLHRHRWTTPAVSRWLPDRDDNDNDSNNSDSDHHYWRKEYRRRHRADQEAQACMDRLTGASSATVPTTEEGEVDDGGVDDMAHDVSQVMASGEECMDHIWKVWRRHKDDHNNNTHHNSEGNAQDDEKKRNDDDDNNNNNNNNELSREALVVICLLRSVHCSVVFEDIRTLCSGNNPIVMEDPTTEMEEYVIASSRMFFDIDVSDGPRDTTSGWIRQELDDIAALVRKQWSQQQQQQHQHQHQHDESINISTEDKLAALNLVFFDQLEFSGNTENYYDFHNSMLHSALKRRTGIPMTLAVLYKCIARRIDLHVDIIGLPGHIVIGVPDLNCYLDVFRRGRHFLTLVDCERIVNSYGHAMSPEFIRPLAPAHVFRRIINNIGSCLAQSFPPNASKRMGIEAMRAVLINPTNDQVWDCRRWFSQILWGVTSQSILKELSQW